MFEHILSIIGIGASRVDTVLTQPDVVRGQMMSGEVRMFGGKTDQSINGIALELVTDYRLPLDIQRPGYEIVLWEHSLSEIFTLKAGQEKILPFRCLVPMNTPISQGPAKVWLNTRLDVALAVDPKDRDPLQVQAEPATAQLLNAAADLGFVQTADSGSCIGVEGQHEIQVVQAFVFESGANIQESLSGITKLELIVLANSYDAEIQIEVNRPAAGLSGWLPDQASHSPQAKNRAVFRLRHDLAFGPEQLAEKLHQLLAGL